ncbi:MAG: 5-oxoprolinase subunit PxpB [Mycobacteriales bacterium]
MEVLPYGRDGLLLELPSLAEVQALHADLGAAGFGLEELVPAALTVLVVAAPAELERIRRWLAGWRPRRHRAAGEGPAVEIPVRYDGPDLAAVAEHAGCPVEEVVRLHTAGRYTVAFCGFAPGFGYLTGGPAALHVPRHPEPRTSVPAGAVGLAGEFTGVYPRSSPGGWQLIGRTEVAVFDPDRDPPALLAPGTRVSFTAVDR